MENNKKGTISIDFGEALMYYTSGNAELKKLAIMAYSEEDIESAFPYGDIKSFDDISEDWFTKHNLNKENVSKNLFMTIRCIRLYMLESIDENEMFNTQYGEKYFPEIILSTVERGSRDSDIEKDKILATYTRKMDGESFDVIFNNIITYDEDYNYLDEHGEFYNLCELNSFMVFPDKDMARYFGKYFYKYLIDLCYNVNEYTVDFVDTLEV